MTMEQKLVSYSNASKLEEIVKRFGEAKVLLGLTWSSMMIEGKRVTKYKNPLSEALLALTDANMLYKRLDENNEIRRELAEIVKYLESISKNPLYNMLLKLPWVSKKINEYLTKKLYKRLLNIYNRLEEEGKKLKQDLINMYPNKRLDIESMFRKIETSEYILKKTKYFKQLMEDYS